MDMNSYHFAPNLHPLFTDDICTNLSSLGTFLLSFHDVLQHYENGCHKRNTHVTKVYSNSLFNLRSLFSAINMSFSNLLISFFYITKHSTKHEATGNYLSWEL